MADAPAAAAAPPPAAAPPSTPSGKSPAPFDTRLALAKSLHRVLAPAADDGAADGGTDGGAEGEAADGGAEGADTGADQGDTADSTSAAEAAEGDGAADGEARTPEAQLEAVTKAFASGDIEAMAKALEQPGVKIAGPVRRAFRAFARRSQQLDQREQAQKDRDRSFEDAKQKAQQAIAEDTRRLSEGERNFTRKYGTSFAIEQAWENEDTLALGKALERACKGASLAEITQKLASGKQGKTPEERALAEERRKFEETKAAEQKKGQDAESLKRQQQSREAAVGRIGEALKSHPYLQGANDKGEKVLDQEALSEVFTAYEASWNGEKFTKTARQCADELQEKLLARAKARGLAVAPAAPAAGKTPAGKAAPTAQRKPAPRGKEPPRTQSGKGGALDLEATRANRIAMARRTTEMQRRGVR